eukprot:g48442.t1
MSPKKKKKTKLSWSRLKASKVTRMRLAYPHRRRRKTSPYALVEGTYWDKRTPPPSSKRQKLEASPSSEESPAPSAAATATPTTSSSMHQLHPTPSSRASQTHSTTWWLNSAMRREDELLRAQLAQSKAIDVDLRVVTHWRALEDCLYADLQYISDLQHDQEEINEEKVKTLLNRFIKLLSLSVSALLYRSTHSSSNDQRNTAIIGILRCSKHCFFSRGMSVPAVWEAAGLSYAQFVNKCTVATRFAVRSELLASTYPLRRPFPEPAPAVSNGRQFFRRRHGGKLCCIFKICLLNLVSFMDML